MRTARSAFLALALLTPGIAGAETLAITEDTTLDPGVEYGPIVVKASGVTIDGRGALISGPGGASPKEFRGVAISAEGVSGVTLKDVRAKGWETGLRIKDGEGWTVEGCDFSDNFHDPEFGWGEQGRRGGIVLENVRNSTLRKNRANRVWDACVLLDSDDNTIVENDFSHASNTCLKLWHARRNEARKNVLSYGLRIKAGEVHARDSAGLLIESGSDDNRFFDNDCTHGGDGIFVRVLNGRVSAGNLFERNDASFANNNGFEAWAPRNTYRDNKANGCSYGFWLGASDGTVLEGNEANDNGLPGGFHNSPHLPRGGHAGIVFMFGPSSHTIARGNTCKNNNGAGIALLGDLATKGGAWKAFHWVLEGNTLADNRWGLFAQHADWLDLSGNAFLNNREEDFHRDATVTNVHERPASPGGGRPRASLKGPSVAKVGEMIELDASASGRATAFRWDLGDGTIAEGAKVEHRFRKPGFARVGLTATDGHSADLAYRDLYIVDDREEVGTEGDVADWSWIDPQSKVRFGRDRSIHLVGGSSVRADVRPYSGGRVTLSCKPAGDRGVSLAGKEALCFWVKSINNNSASWQGPNPIITLISPGGETSTLTPKPGRLEQPPYNEAREGWTLYVVPLAGGRDWAREGSEIATAEAIAIGFDSWGAEPLRIWIDGLTIR